MKKLLIVDDERDITFMIKQVLEDQYEVDTANDPFKVLTDFKPETYDLLILDISMPKMNGFDLYRELKKSNKDTRVLIITAMELANYAPYMNFRKEFPGFDDLQVMRKPFSIDELTERIDKVLKI